MFAYGSETCVLSDTEVECESWKVGIEVYMSSQSIGGVSNTTQHHPSVGMWKSAPSCGFHPAEKDKKRSAGNMK